MGTTGAGIIAALAAAAAIAAASGQAAGVAVGAGRRTALTGRIGVTGRSGPAGEAPVTGAPAVTGSGVAASGSGSGGVLGGAELTRPGVIVNYPSQGSPRVPRVPADAFVIADAGTGQILAARRPHAWYGPASTLKILTAISLIPVLDPDATVVASKLAVDAEPDVVGLKPGRRYKVADLFRALLLISGNDAAIALAQATGSFTRGIALMNAEAHQLQADDTVAVQPNGLDARGQHVSAYDEALIARRALQIPAFLAYDETLSTWFPITPRHKIELFNEDQLLTSYRGFLGGKTGWTTPAMAAYVGMARRNGHILIVTLLHAVPGTLFTSAKAMLNWGFRMDGKVRPVGELVSPLPPNVPPPLRRSYGPLVAVRGTRAGPSSGPLLPLTAALTAAAVLGLGAYGLVRRRTSRR